MSRTRKMMVAGLTVGVMAVGFAACDPVGKATEPFKDAPRSGVVNDDPADTVTMPDGFNNVATKCDHGNRVYVTYHADSPYGSVAVVPNDPTCQ